MQRTKALPRDEVGSLLRPPRSSRRAPNWRSGEISAADRRKVEDMEIEKVVHKQASIGLKLATRRRIPPLVVAFRLSGETHGCETVSPRHGHSVRRR